MSADVDFKLKKVLQKEKYKRIYKEGVIVIGAW
jgi:hypothetical protein